MCACRGVSTCAFNLGGFHFTGARAAEMKEEREGTEGGRKGGKRTGTGGGGVKKMRAK